jgi:hypothetical protein
MEEFKGLTASQLEVIKLQCSSYTAGARDMATLITESIQVNTDQVKHTMEGKIAAIEDAIKKLTQDQ